MKILEQIEHHYSKQLPFVVYRKPNEKNVKGWFLQTDDLFFTDDFSESGFVFSPFKIDEKSILFPVDQSIHFSEHLDPDDVTFGDSEVQHDIISKEHHINLVEQTIEAIKKSSLRKVVISRKELIKIDELSILSIYTKLLSLYIKAFVYVWYHPKIGLWFGATPETLVKISNMSFKTMSLAGTQVFKENKKVTWGAKEIEEQQLVTDFIENQVQNISSNLQISTAETVRAGSLLHLKSSVEGELNKNATLKELIRALHPTPAVCGLPREQAKAFILQHENYNRTFYTGFLGELNMSDDTEKTTSHLFVNLRCMEINNTKASIFVGGGITKDSVAINEWEETVAKTVTMKTVLK